MLDKQTHKKRSYQRYKPHTNAVVRNIMADGTVLTPEELDGYVVPYNETTAPAYRILAKWIDEAWEKEQQKNSPS